MVNENLLIILGVVIVLVFSIWALDKSVKRTKKLKEQGKLKKKPWYYYLALFLILAGFNSSRDINQSAEYHLAGLTLIIIGLALTLFVSYKEGKFKRDFIFMISFIVVFIILAFILPESLIIYALIGMIIIFGIIEYSLNKKSSIEGIK